MPSNATTLQLVHITDPWGFEDLCMDALVRDDMPYLKQWGGGGPGDGGRDAVGKDPTGKMVIGAFSLRKDWKRKLQADLKRIHSLGHLCDRVVFVTNQQPTAAEQDEAGSFVKAKYGWDFELRGVKWLSTQVDLYPELRHMHAGLFPLDHQRRPVIPVDIEAHVKGLEAEYRDWRARYSPLMADAYEFDLYALQRTSTRRRESAPGTRVASLEQVKVTDLPDTARCTVLLGESGSGKTTTLWRIALDHAQRWLAGESRYAPVLVNLKHWTPTTKMHHLVAQAFARVQADPAAVAACIRDGGLLLLLDGLNELPASPTEREEAQRDIHAFLQELGQHIVVITCRTPDYDPAFVATDHDNPPMTFETSRLSASQVRDYVVRRFPEEEERAEQLLSKLRVDDRTLWDHAASFIHLARLPLHLQVLVEEFKATGEVPRNKATLLQRLIRRMGRNTFARRAPYLDDHSRDQVLSAVAGQGVASRRYLSLPVTLARKGVGQCLTDLVHRQELPREANVTEVWQELLSDNFFTLKRVVGESAISRDPNEVEWLHQAVFDYSLALKLTRAVQDLEVSERPTLPPQLDSWLAQLPGILDQPCQIALGLLAEPDRVVLFDLLVRQPNDLASRVLIGEEPDDADALILASLDLVLDDDDRFMTDLAKVALLRSHRKVAARLMQVFKGRSLEEKREIARINCEIAIHFQGGLAAKRALQSAHAWLANQDEWIKFYAAKAAWGGPQRGEAGMVLQQLRQAKSMEVRLAAAKLGAQWGGG